MHEGNILQLLLGQVRRKTIDLLTNAPVEALRWTPPAGGTQNHVLWHAGHALWLGDVLCIEPATGRGELPPGWAATFGAKERPPSQTHEWPSRDDVIAHLRRQEQRMFEVIGGLTQQELDKSPGGRTGETLATWIVHGLHDEAKHQGEMFLLLKLWRHANAAPAPGAAGGRS